MDIHLHIDDRLVRPLRWVFRRRVARALLVTAILVTSGALYAQATAPAPLATFTAGEVISASAINGNFAALEARIAAIETDGAKLRGYELVTATFDLPVNDTAGGTARCPDNKRAVGGGWMNDATGQAGTEVMWDRMLPTRGGPFPGEWGSAWQILLRNTATTGSTRHIVMYAICVE